MAGGRRDAPAVKHLAQQRILVVRERHVMLDDDPALLYGVQTRRLVEQVKRNIDRSPADFNFMFQLKKDEAIALRSQSATSKAGRGGRRDASLSDTRV